MLRENSDAKFSISGAIFTEELENCFWTEVMMHFLLSVKKVCEERGRYSRQVFIGFYRKSRNTSDERNIYEQILGCTGLSGGQ